MAPHRTTAGNVIIGGDDASAQNSAGGSDAGSDGNQLAQRNGDPYVLSGSDHPGMALASSPLTAVLRRERDKHIAFSHSRDPSSASSTSSSFNHNLISTSQFDQDGSLVRREGSQLPMDYSDLTLDHRQWKTMLPPNKREVVWRSASLGFSVDRKTGKNCFMLGATNLIINSGDEFEHIWESKSHPKTRFSEVAKLKYSTCFYVKGSIQTNMLSPETLYAAYFVFGDPDKYKKELTIDSSIKICYGESDDDYSEWQARIVNLKPRKGREDGWKEIQLGDFYNGGDNGKVIVELVNHTLSCSLSGLIIEGIEFRPLKGKKSTTGKKNFPNSEDGRKFGCREMPSNYDNWKKLVRAVKKEQLRQIALMTSSNSSSISYKLFSQIAQSLEYDAMDDGSFWERTYSGKYYQETVSRSVLGKAVFLPVEAREFIIRTEDFPERQLPYSFRFTDAVEVNSVLSLDIRGKIKTRLLTSKTIYGVYLVFKLDGKFMGFESAKAMIRFINDETDVDAERRANVVHLQPVDERKGETAVKRPDRWMEVQIGRFFVDKVGDQEVEARLMETSIRWKTGLIVRGIEFRPLVNVKNVTS